LRISPQGRANMVAKKNEKEKKKEKEKKEKKIEQFLFVLQKHLRSNNMK
jgi:hypothetical protein